MPPRRTTKSSGWEFFRKFSDMSIRFDGNAVLWQLITSTMPFTTTPFTMCCFFYTKSSTSTQTLMGISEGVSDSENPAHLLDINNNRIEAVSDGTIAEGRTAAITGPGRGNFLWTWHHAAGVWTSATSRRAYIDGTFWGNDTVSIIPTGLNRCTIGFWKRDGANTSNPMNGLIAHAACWDVALESHEIKELANGILPWYIRRGSLKGWWPLHRESMRQRFALDYSFSQNHMAATAVFASPEEPWQLKRIRSFTGKVGATPESNFAPVYAQVVRRNVCAVPY